jgi:membrane-bound serine protease (ClpP class)
MDKNLIIGRLISSTVGISAEEAAIYVVWRWLLPEWGIRLHVAVLVAVMAAWFAFSVWLFIFTTRYLMRQPTAGLPSMVGTTGRAAGPLAPGGMVRIRGELWGATSIDGDIRGGEGIVVIAQEGLKLRVKRAKPARN